jgi:hypothetical protein
MKKQEQTESLYHLTDNDLYFHNVVFICGEPWVTKCLRPSEAIIYTEEQMQAAQLQLRKEKIRAYPQIIERKKP